MIRYTFVIFLSLVIFIPSAYSTNTDETKLKALESEIKKLEQEREELNIKLNKFKKRNAETKETLIELRKKNKHIITNRRRYDERYGKSYVDGRLIEINNAIQRGEKRKEHDEKQIDKGTKIIENKDRIISDKKITYERMKQILIEKKNKATVYVKDFNEYIPAGDGIKYWLQDKHYDGKDMGTGTIAYPNNINEVLKSRNYPNGPIIEIQIIENGIKTTKYTPKYSFKQNDRNITIKDKLLDVKKAKF